MSIGLAANTGLIKLGGGSIIYGPFKHYLEDITRPPAILLGLESDLEQDPFAPLFSNVLDPSLVQADVKLSTQQTYAVKVVEAVNTLPEDEKVEVRTALGEGFTVLESWVGEHGGETLAFGQEEELIKVLGELKVGILERRGLLPRVLKSIIFMEDYEYMKDYPGFKAICITLSEFYVSLDSSPIDNKLESIELRWWAIPAVEQEYQYQQK